MLSFITQTERELLDRIASIAEREAMPLRVVGGFVRDRLLIAANRLPVPPKPEMDFVTTGDAIKLAAQVATLFPGSRHYQYGHFGTARVDWNEWMFEFATARTESYRTESRNPVVETATFEEDAARRDFTVNALAWGVNGLEYGVLFDPFGGVRDLENGILRTPLDPGKTFSDDPLRMLRAARFVAKLNFAIDPVTEHGITEHAARIEIVHIERIADEFLQMMAAPFPHLGVKLLFRTGVLAYILPEIVELHGVDQRGKHSHKDVFTHTMQVLENSSGLSDDIAVRLSALFHDVAKPQTKKYLPEIGWTFYGHEVLGVRTINRIFRRLRLSNLLAKRVGKITRLHMRPVRLAQEGVTDSAIRRLRVEAGEELVPLLQLCRADITSANPKRVEKYLQNYQTMMQRLDLVEKRDHLKSFQSPIRGDEIAELCGIPFGPRIGMIKTAIEEAILDGTILNEYEPAKAWLLENRERLLSMPEQRVKKKSLEQLDDKQLERLLQAVRENHEQSESNE